MQVARLIEVMERLAPTRFAEAWDNVGLLIGDPSQPLTRVLLAIDYTEAVAGEAIEKRCDAVIAYHPPIFKELKRVTNDGASKLIFDAVRRGIAIYSPHTALDVADGGTNDVLADAIGMYDRSPLKPADPKATQHKLVTFIPVDALERVSDALFAAGAGKIGNYTSCSFRSEGTGTFKGEAGKTNPAVGQAGKFEQSAEVRIETVVPITKISEIIAALRKSHPYEEPAFDLISLAAPPEARGIGRIGKIPDGATGEMLANLLKRALGIEHVLVAGDDQKLIRKAAVCAGSCGGLLDDAIRQKVDLYLTGEMRHHDALKAAAAGVCVVCTLHSNSERATLAKVRDTLLKELPGLTASVSEVDRDPFRIQ